MVKKKKKKPSNKVFLKKNKKKKTNHLVYILLMLGLIFIIVIFVLLWKRKNKDVVENNVPETTKAIEINESIVNKNEKDKFEEEEIKYSLNDFAEMLKEHGAQVTIEEISSNDGKKNKCLIATSKGIYEDFDGLDWISPNIVMNAVSSEGIDTLVTAKRLASDIKTIYCNWNIGNKYYQVITLDSEYVGDFLNAINNYILEKC